MSNATPPADVSTKPTQRFRRLRIAVSVFFAVLTVALCELWVQSYNHQFSFWWQYTNQYSFAIASEVGSVLIGLRDRERPGVGFTRNEIDKESADTLMSVWRMETNGSGFGVSGSSAIVPYWSIMLCLAPIAALAWPSWQFSLRTMLIVTTLVAFVLGLGVWMAS
jgi:hypothetical protein